MSSGGEWHGELGTPLSAPWTDRAEWALLTESMAGPLWWAGGTDCNLDLNVTLVPGVAPPEVARIELRRTDGTIAGAAVPRPSCGAFILATEVLPVIPVAVGADGRDLIGPDDQPLINQRTFFGWESFAGSPPRAQ